MLCCNGDIVRFNGSAFDICPHFSCDFSTSLPSLSFVMLYRRLRHMFPTRIIIKFVQFICIFSWAFSPLQSAALLPLPRNSIVFFLRSRFSKHRWHHRLVHCGQMCGRYYYIHFLSDCIERHMRHCQYCARLFIALNEVVFLTSICFSVFKYTFMCGFHTVKEILLGFAIR